MYVIKDGKVYVQDGDNKLVGVEIYPSEIVKLTDIEIEDDGENQLYTPFEIRAKFQIHDGESYIFPRDNVKTVETGVDENEPVDSIKKPVGRPKRQ